MEVQRKLASLDVILWLRENYKVGKNGSVSKNSVYQHYFDSCQEKGIEPVISATYFGKLVKRAFPGIKYNRKGPRGSAVQHYTCLKRAKIGVDVGLAGASPYPEYGTPGGGAVIAGGAFTAEELALCQYSLKRERLEHADPDSPSLDHAPGTFSPRRRQAMFPHPFAHGYPPPPSSSHHHYHHPPPPHPHAQHYPHHQPPQHFATEAPAHAYHHRAPPSSHARDAGLRSPTGDELSAPWTLERDHSAPPPVAMMRGSHAPPTAPAYQAQHRHQHAAVTNARSRASPHPYDLVERRHHHHQQQQQQPHLSPDPGDHPHPHTRHEYPAHHSSHYGHPAAHLRSPSLQLGYPAHDHDNDHERDHHHQQQQHHHHQQQHHQHHPYYHQQHLQQRSSAPLLPSPRGHASSSGASPHPHAGYRFQAMVRGHASHASANSSPTSPSGSSHLGSSNPPSPPSPPPHLLLPSLDSATFATPLLPSSTATATASGGASIGGLRNSPTATDHHHHQQQHNNSNSNNRHNVAAAASTTPNADETRHDQRQQVPAATSSSSELAAPASSSSVPHAFEPSMEDMYPLPTFTSEDLERHQPQPQPQQHSHQQHQQQQSLRPPLGRSSSPALEHLLRGIASRDVEDEELVSFYDHYLKA